MGNNREQEGQIINIDWRASKSVLSQATRFVNERYRFNGGNPIYDLGHNRRGYSDFPEICPLTIDSIRAVNPSSEHTFSFRAQTSLGRIFQSMANTVGEYVAKLADPIVQSNLVQVTKTLSGLAILSKRENVELVLEATGNKTFWVSLLRIGSLEIEKID